MMVDFENEEIVDEDLDYLLLFSDEKKSNPGCLTWIIFFIGVLIWFSV